MDKYESRTLGTLLALREGESEETGSVGVVAESGQRGIPRFASQGSPLPRPNTKEINERPTMATICA
jgi:hypothetical protein